MTHYRSNRRAGVKPRYYAIGLVAVFAVVLPSLSTFAALVTTDRYIVAADDRVREDQYVTATSGQIEGVVDGDLTIFTGSLDIRGEVTGSVTVFTVGSVTIEEGATIGGSLRGTAGSVHVEGDVEGDVFVGAASVVIDETGSVGRDVIGLGGAMSIDGEVARDVRGRTVRTTVRGHVGGDVDIATQNLDVVGSASVGGDILYRSSSDASIDDDARITGTITKLPTRGNFVYGVILSIATVISFLGFLVTGIVALWLLRSSSSRAVGAILGRPIRSFLIGLFTVIIFPAAILILAATLVGLPLAAIGVMIAVAAVVIGPVPAVTALGNRILINRGGLFGAFVAGAVLWRLGISFIPVVGGFLYVIALVWGVGAWVLGLAASRRGDEILPVLLPASMVVDDEVPEDWEPPLAPVRMPETGSEARDHASRDSTPMVEEETPESELDPGHSEESAGDLESGSKHEIRFEEAESVQQDEPEPEARLRGQDLRAAWEREMRIAEQSDSDSTDRDDPDSDSPNRDDTWGLPSR